MGMSDHLMFSTALVTGASSGLGEEYAMQLALRSKHLVLTARREDLLRGLADRIRNAHPRVEVTVIAADLVRPEERLRLVEELFRQALVPDLLVNNAGMGDYGEFVSADWQKLESMIRLNMEALTHLTHALLPGMIRQGRGAVMNVSSLASLLPIPDFAVYAATKAYVTSFSEALRLELRNHRIPVLAVCPGPVHTGFGDVARRSPDSKLPVAESFCVPKEQVVAESLMALDQDRARVFPSLKVAAAALVISVLPIVLLRLVMARRPRRS
jgi:uncharacterized protein